MRAAVWYNICLATKDRIAKQRCLDSEAAAITAWKDIIKAAGEVYSETLKFGVRRKGFPWHWKEELVD